jgi:hypothetical protein
VAVTVTNSGNTLASGPVSVAVAASADATLGADVTLGTVTKNLKLKPGASKTLRLKFLVPETLSGGVFVAQVDSAGAVAESNETDNGVVGGAFTVT